MFFNLSYILNKSYIILKSESLSSSMQRQCRDSKIRQNGEDDNYFEKQKTFSLQCGMYSINHLLKRKVYTVQDMQQICYNLSTEFINPHKHILGGDYDANVIIIGLQNQGCQCEWVDKRKSFNIKQHLQQKNQSNTRMLIGFLVNIPQPKKFYHSFLRFSSRHWLAIRLHGEDGKFAICDSNENSLEVVQNQKQLEKLMKKYVDNQGQIICVYKKLAQG